MVFLKIASQCEKSTLVFQAVERRVEFSMSRTEPPLNLPLIKGERPRLAHANLWRATLILDFRFLIPHPYLLPPESIGLGPRVCSAQSRWRRGRNTSGVLPARRASPRHSKTRSVACDGDLGYGFPTSGTPASRRRTIEATLKSPSSSILTGKTHRAVR
jgi:hypothetical protein